MFRFLKELFTENLGMKALALFIALVMWFYIVKALNQGSREDVQLMRQVTMADRMVGKKLEIRPVFIGRPQNGFVIPADKIIVNPGYCIVVGTSETLSKIKFALTVPIDVTGVNKTYARAIPLNPIAPGVYMEETLVEVTVPVERAR
jgi:YbbR domain-containing protein